MRQLAPFHSELYGRVLGAEGQFFQLCFNPRDALGLTRHAPAVSFRPSHLAALNQSHRLKICHPERTPDFLPRGTNQRPRMRLSLRKAARGLPAPLSLTGNPEEAEGPAVSPSGAANVRWAN